MNNLYRTNYCGKVLENDVDKEILVSGWVENIRDHGGVIFVDLRDETGTVQLVSNDPNMFLHLTKESVLKVDGKVRKRDEDDYNREAFSPDNLYLFLSFLGDIDEKLCKKDPEHVAWYGKDTTLSGIYGAFGNYLNFDNNNVNESINKLQQIIEKKIDNLDFNVDEFENAYMNLSSVSVNVGNVIRKGIFEYTLAALQGIKKTWYNCLINK